MDKLWEVMNLYHHIAVSNGHGVSWANMCKKKSYNATEKAMHDFHLKRVNLDDKEYLYVADALCDTLDVIFSFDNETNDGSIEYFSDSAIDFMMRAFKIYDDGE